MLHLLYLHWSNIKFQQLSVVQNLFIKNKKNKKKQKTCIFCPRYSETLYLQYDEIERWEEFPLSGSDEMQDLQQVNMEEV